MKIGKGGVKIDRIFTVIVNDSEKKYVEEKSSNLKFSNEKYEELGKKL